jgi:ribonuclease P protein component
MPSIAREITRFSKKEIDYLFQHARRLFKSTFFIILCVPRQHEFGKILIVVSKKVGNAPERNKIRRQIKSIFYEEALFESSYDYVIIVYKTVLKLSFNEIKKLILSVIRNQK